MILTRSFMQITEKNTALWCNEITSRKRSDRVNITSHRLLSARISRVLIESRTKSKARLNRHKPTCNNNKTKVLALLKTTTNDLMNIVT